jgi:hypothetical protein
MAERRGAATKTGWPQKNAKNAKEESGPKSSQQNLKSTDQCKAARFTAAFPKRQENDWQEDS